MPSPFPGMDPYIEWSRRWPPFHTGYITTCCDVLNERLPENYVATVEERVQLETDADDETEPRTKRLGPDVAVVQDPGGTRARPAAVIATLEPRRLPQPIEWLDEPTQKYIEILGLPEQGLVTTLELLSPANKKPGRDRTAYLVKRQDLLRRGVNLVEVDLLLRGGRLPMLAPLPAGDYFAFVTGSESYTECDVYSWGLRDPLPTIPVPLRTEDGAVSIDLAGVFARTYDRGRFARLTPYHRLAPVGLNPDDSRWAADLVRK